MSGGAVGQTPTPTPVCGTTPHCVENLSFAATVTDFRTELQNQGQKRVTMRLSIKNKLTRRLTLGYVYSSGVATDDRNNGYTLGGERALQGIGQIQGAQADSKFQLEPGETSDARFEFTWGGQQLFGVTFQVDLALREIEPLEGGQLRLGREYALRFPGLTDMLRAPASGTVATPSAPPTGSAPTGPLAEQANACAGRKFCQTAGPISAQIVGLSMIHEGPTTHGVQMRMLIRNFAPAPVVLAYVSESAIMIDEHGQRYSRFGPEVRGMGTVAAGVADTQFVLPPGGTGVPMFFAWFASGSGREPVGTQFNADLSLALLEALPGSQSRTVREYALGFSNLSATALAGATPSTEACAGKPRCYSEGPFLAEVTAFTGAQDPSYRRVQVQVRFQNLTAQPIVLGYVTDSAAVLDSCGQTYQVPRGDSNAVRGIGLVDPQKADTRFVLGAGASGTAAFSAQRPSTNSRLGPSYQFDAAIALLEVLPGQQVHTVREYALSVPTLSLTGPSLLTRLSQETPVQGFTGSPCR